MLISTDSVNKLAERISSSMETFCSGLFLSARWFAVSQLDFDGMQLVVLPDKDSAEYCAADLYNLIVASLQILTGIRKKEYLVAIYKII